MGNVSEILNNSEGGTAPAETTPEPLELANGFLCDASWELPQMVTKSTVANRADQGNMTMANEFMDTEEVLREKMKIVASLIEKSRMTVAYTGAGLSKASGIPDYATKGSTVVQSQTIRSPWEAQPTYTHLALTALEHAGKLHHYVQQNHDGLPQKAGFPQTKINEIHGAWYDPSNPVVQFDGKLRTDLYNWMKEVEDQVDLCLCLGTSLSGMNADRIADKPARRSLREKPSALGTVIINLQQTQLDNKCCVRVWSRLDDAFRILMDILHVEIPVAPTPPMGDLDVFEIPYDSTGQHSTTRTQLDLSNRARIKIVHPQAPNHGKCGSIEFKDPQGNYVIQLDEVSRTCRLGWWWVMGAMLGDFEQLPLVNEVPVEVTTTAATVTAADPDTDHAVDTTIPPPCSSSS
ncbi:NAD-dependent protein deacetylase sirtuin-7 [Pelomyxa schiedti]|nr:NAD-dependent protein deacetylase sirtuin-7 [Pelomyxa schiedti]